MADEPEISKDAISILRWMAKKSSDLPDGWDGGLWDVTCAKQLAEIMLRNGGLLHPADQASLLMLGATLIERIRRAAEAEASVKAMLGRLMGGSTNG